MRLAELVDVSAAVAATASRSAKVRALAELLRRLAPDEVAIAVGFLTGEPRQGKVGVGWATVSGVEATPADSPLLTLPEVDVTIAAVRATSGPGSAGRRREILGGLLGRATAEEADFLRRLFTGELRQGALEGVMADAIAKAADVDAAAVRRAAMLSGDLGRVAALALAGGVDALSGIGMQVFRPVLPMLASIAESVAEALEDLDEASVEWKLDGIRIQIHRAGGQVRVYTRNLNDVTDRLPDVVRAVLALEVDQAVFDGEAIGLGPDERPGAFQDTMSLVGRDTEPATGVVPFLFDCLHLEGEDLLDEPLRLRRARLASVAPRLVIPSVVTSSPAEAQKALEDALAAGHEGVVAKDSGSRYAAGRRGRAWRKVKPVRTLDLVVLGAEWGHGRRRGWLSNLHLGARDPSGGFLMVGKTFKGLTDELLDWQTRELLARETHREGIVVYARPELVVEIGLDGVQVSPRYPGGVALRFARVKRYRPDKSAADADTIDTVRAMLPGR